MVLVSISLSIFTCLKHVKINPVFFTGRFDKENNTGDTPRRTELGTKLPELFPPSLERRSITNV